MSCALSTTTWLQRAFIRYLFVAIKMLSNSFDPRMYVDMSLCRLNRIMTIIESIQYTLELEPL